MWLLHNSYFIVLLLLPLGKIFSQNNWDISSENRIPTELSLLVDCLNKSKVNFKLEQINNLNIAYNSFNRGLMKFSPIEAKSFLKEQIYRYILELTPDSLNSDFSQNQSTLSTLELSQIFKNYKSNGHQAHCAFTSWILQSIESDLLTTQKNPGLLSDKLSRYLSIWPNIIKTGLANSEDNNKLAKSLVDYYLTIFIRLSERALLFEKFSNHSSKEVAAEIFKSSAVDSSILEKSNASIDETSNYLGPNAIQDNNQSASELIENNKNVIPNNDKSPVSAPVNEELDKLFESQKKGEILASPIPTANSSDSLKWKPKQ